MQIDILIKENNKTISKKSDLINKEAKQTAVNIRNKSQIKIDKAVNLMIERLVKYGSS